MKLTLIIGAIAGAIGVHDAATANEGPVIRVGQLPHLLVPVKAIRVIDGDTFEAVAHVWPGLSQQAKIRIDGIDAPELRGNCAAEKERGAKAKEWLREHLADAALVQLVDPVAGSFGRVRAGVLVDGESVADRLLLEGLAQPWRGRKRDYWCREEPDPGKS